jgi:hypothetical protein
VSRWVPRATTLERVAREAGTQHLSRRYDSSRAVFQYRTYCACERCHSFLLSRASFSVAADTRVLHRDCNGICALVSLLYVLHVVADFDIILWARFVQAFEEDAGFADVLAGEVAADVTLAHDLLIRLSRCGGFLPFLARRKRYSFVLFDVFGSDLDFEILINGCVVLRQLFLHVRHVGADSPPVGAAAAAFFFFRDGHGAGADAAAAFVAAGYEARHVFAAAYDVEDGAGPDAFEVLDEGAGAAAEGFGGVDALGAEVVEVLVVGVEDDFLFVCVLERFAALDVRV